MPSCRRILARHRGSSSVKSVDVAMDKYLVTPKRKMADDITENFDANGDIKKSKGNHVRSEGFAITEVRGDLFTCPDGTSLAHCISQDIRMGKGIATHFKTKYGGVQELTEQGKKPGDVAVLKRGLRYVYYLVTKERYWQKPTYLSLRSSLQAMKRHSILHNVAAIAMPRIGCGLDGLVWDRVREILTDVFKDTDIKISVYTI